MIAALCLVPTESKAEPMTGEELKTLYANNVTACGEYIKNTKRITYCEYWRKDGTILGKDSELYTGTYYIKAEEGLVCVNYGDQEDICGSYEHKSDDLYTIQRHDGRLSDVTIVKGNTENLK